MTVEAEIRIVVEMMIKAHYFSEANWLGLAVESPSYCRSEQGRRQLREVAKIAREFGFPAVANYVEERSNE